MTPGTATRTSSDDCEAESSSGKRSAASLTSIEGYKEDEAEEEVDFLVANGESALGLVESTLGYRDMIIDFKEGIQPLKIGAVNKGVRIQRSIYRWE